VNERTARPLSEDRRRLVEQHRGIAIAVAWRIAQRLPARVDVEDLISFGEVGLVKAGSAFDPSRGASFGTYAYIRARGEIMDALRKMEWFDEARFHEREYDRHETGTTTDANESELTSFALRKELYDAVVRLPDTQFRLLKLYYFDGLPLARAAEQLGLSRSWASRLHGQALVTLRRSMSDSGS
jgi:RNA polymerase sigma factor FliA